MEQFLQTYALSTQILKFLPQGEPTQFYLEAGMMAGIIITLSVIIVIKQFNKYFYIGCLHDLFKI